VEPILKGIGVCEADRQQRRCQPEDALSIHGAPIITARVAARVFLNV
jgi:hypothetical protein